MELENFELSQDEIWTNEEGLIRRFIYERVALYPEEVEALQELTACRLNNERDKLRFLYAWNWDLMATKKSINEHIQWLKA